MAIPSLLLTSVADKKDATITGGTLAGTINASATTFSLNSGGTTLPDIYKGSATSLGTNTRLNDTTITADVNVGDFIVNRTDGSYAIVESVSVGSHLTTTPLTEGSDNTFQNSDDWVVNPFIGTFYTLDTDGKIALSEQVYIVSKVGNNFIIETGGRGFAGTTAREWNTSTDTVYFSILVVKTTTQDLIEFTSQNRNIIQENTEGTRNYVTSTGGTNAYVITNANVSGELSDKLEAGFYASFSNTGACTAALNGTAAKDIKKSGGVDLDADDIKEDMYVKIKYDSDNDYYQMITPTGAAIPSGDSLQDTRTSGEALAIRDAVFGNATTSKEEKIDADLPLEAAAFKGFMKEAATATDQSKLVQMIGSIISGFSGRTENATYFLDGATPGGITKTPPTGKYFRAGLAISDTEILSLGAMRCVSGDLSGSNFSTITITTGFKPIFIITIGQATISDQWQGIGFWAAGIEAGFTVEGGISSVSGVRFGSVSLPIDTGYIDINNVTDTGFDFREGGVVVNYDFSYFAFG